MIHHYKDIGYRLVRSRRKTASIYIERDGSISVLVPKEVSDKDVEKLLESKRGWIYRGIAEWQDLNSSRVQREFVSGEGFLYLGKSYRLQIVSEQQVDLILKDGYFWMRQDCVPKAKQTFQAFYREKGIEKIGQRIIPLQKQLHVEPTDIHMQDIKNRWASCSPNGRINFHWKCLMAPLSVLDYIIAHELVHLIHPNHSEAFWNELDKLLPDYRERQKWLSVHGAGMDL